MADVLQEAVVQVAPDGAGKKVRNFSLVALQSDGTFATVHVQGTISVDPYTGTPLEPFDHGKVDETNRLLRAVVRGLEILTETNLLEGE